MSVTTEAPGSWPDTRQPDNTKIDEQIRDLGWDPVTKRIIIGYGSAIPMDFDTKEGKKFLSDALGSGDYHVFVRSQLLSMSPGPFSAVSDVYSNCTSGTAPVQLQWSQNVSTTTSFDVTTSVEASFFEVVKASMSASFGMSWTVSESFSQSYGMDVPSKHLGWMERAPNLQTITGEIWLIWKNFYRLAWYGSGQITGQATDGRPKGMLIAKERPMSEGEANQLCSMYAGAPDCPVIPALALPYVNALETIQE